MSQTASRVADKDHGEDSFVTVLVRLRDSQREWARSKGYALAPLVRRLLDEEMARESTGTSKGNP